SPWDSPVRRVANAWTRLGTSSSTLKTFTVSDCIWRVSCLPPPSGPSFPTTWPP
ncbi:Putative LOC100743078, partial [Caligus rogercresseyi]